MIFCKVSMKVQLMPWPNIPWQRFPQSSLPHATDFRNLLSKEGQKGDSSVEKGQKGVPLLWFPIRIPHCLYPYPKIVPWKIYQKNIANISFHFMLRSNGLHEMASFNDHCVGGIFGPLAWAPPICRRDWQVQKPRRVKIFFYFHFREKNFFSLL